MIELDVLREWMNESPQLHWMQVAERAGFRPTTEASRAPTAATDQMDAFDLALTLEHAGIETVEDLDDLLVDADEWGSERLEELCRGAAARKYVPHAGPYDVITLLVMVSGRMSKEQIETMRNYRPEIRAAAAAVVEEL